MLVVLWPLCYFDASVDNSVSSLVVKTHQLAQRSASDYTGGANINREGIANSVGIVCWLYLFANFE